MALYALCSKPGCKFSPSYSPKNDSRDTYCRLCGAELLYMCPHCKKRFETKNQSYCGGCGKPIKSAPNLSPVDLSKYRND